MCLLKMAKKIPYPSLRRYMRQAGLVITLKIEYKLFNTHRTCYILHYLTYLLGREERAETVKTTTQGTMDYYPLPLHFRVRLRRYTPEQVPRAGLQEHQHNCQRSRIFSQDCL